MLSIVRNQRLYLIVDGPQYEDYSSKIRKNYLRKSEILKGFAHPFFR